MNVFTDFHHASLLNSFILLFEKRLNGNVYRPIGTDWYEKGYWKIYDHPATVQQFLGIGGATPDGTEPLNKVVDDGIAYTPGIYACHDIDSGQINKAITFDAFMRLKTDIVIASIPAHLIPFRKLCDLHPSHPKLIYQIGNAWNITPQEATLLDGIMASALIGFMGNINGRNGKPLPMITYHQEFDTEIFCHKPLAPSPWICSFVNCFGTDPLFREDWELFQAVEKKMDGFTFKSFGGQCRDGAMHGSRQLSDAMNVSMFIWHTKNGGDGYGHILHNSAAVGRPIIFKKQYYLGKMGEKLMEDGQTGIQIDGLSPDQIKNKIEYFSNPTLYNKLCNNVYNNFRRIVNFDAEFLAIKSFLGNLI